MSHIKWLGTAGLWTCALFIHISMSAAQKPNDEASSSSNTADLAGLKCEIWTVLEGGADFRTSKCYEGEIKTANKKIVTIIATRSRIKRVKNHIFGFSSDAREGWTPLDAKEITVPTNKIDYIRFLREPKPQAGDE